MDRLNVLDWVALILLIIGGLNWGIIGIFEFNVIAAIFGTLTVATRIIYILVGLAAVYVAAIGSNLGRHKP